MSLNLIQLPPMLTAVEVEAYFRVSTEFLRLWASPQAKADFAEGRSKIPPVPMVRSGRSHVYPSQEFYDWLTTYHRA